MMQLISLRKEMDARSINAMLNKGWGDMNRHHDGFQRVGH
jgi:hypothetical protein